jgi:hypothetical protein
MRLSQREVCQRLRKLSHIHPLPKFHLPKLFYSRSNPRPGAGKAQKLMKCAHSAPDMDQTAPTERLSQTEGQCSRHLQQPNCCQNYFTTRAIQRQWNIRDTVDEVACQLFNSRGSNSSCMGNVTKGDMALTLDETNTPHSIKIVPLKEQSNT